MIYKTILRPIVMYVSEAQTLTVKEKSWLKRWGKKIAKDLEGEEGWRHIELTCTNTYDEEYAQTKRWREFPVIQILLLKKKMVGRPCTVDDGQQSCEESTQRESRLEKKRETPDKTGVKDVEEDPHRLGLGNGVYLSLIHIRDTVKS